MSALLTFRKEVQFLPSRVELSPSSIQDLLRVRRQWGWGQGRDQRLHFHTLPSVPVSPAASGSWAAGWGRGKRHEGSYLPCTMVVRCWVPGWFRIRMLSSLLWVPELFLWGFFYIQEPLTFASSAGSWWAALVPTFCRPVVSSGHLVSPGTLLGGRSSPGDPVWLPLQGSSLPHKISAVLSSPVWKCKPFTHQPLISRSGIKY